MKPIQPVTDLLAAAEHPFHDARAMPPSVYTSPDFLAREERHLRVAPAGGNGAASPVSEEFSERELGVLRLLSTEMSQREIGSELFISFNTVKTHSKNIYRKLGVSQRADAIVRARELELI